MRVLKVLSLVVILSFGFGIMVNSDFSVEPTKVEESTDVKPIELTDNNFKKTISKGIVLVDFWAPWCGPCRKQGPIVDELATEYKGKIKVGKVNVDNNKGTSGAYHIRSIPTIIIFKDGKVMTRMTGLKTKEYIESQIKVYM